MRACNLLNKHASNTFLNIQAQSSGRANGDFASEVVFVSQHLNCSEKHCASLLQSVHSSNPNIGRIQAVEYAVLAHHQLRRYLADCLRFIFEAVRVGQRGVGTPFHSRLAEYAKRQLVGSGGEGSLANRLFKQIDQLGQAIVETKTAVTNAVSNTNVPTQGVYFEFMKFIESDDMKEDPQIWDTLFSLLDSSPLYMSDGHLRSRFTMSPALVSLHPMKSNWSLSGLTSIRKVICRSIFFRHYSRPSTCRIQLQAQRMQNRRLPSRKNRPLSPSLNGSSHPGRIGLILHSKRLSC